MCQLVLTRSGQEMVSAKDKENELKERRKDLPTRLFDPAVAAYFEYVWKAFRRSYR